MTWFRPKQTLGLSLLLFYVNWWGSPVGESLGFKANWPTATHDVEHPSIVELAKSNHHEYEGKTNDITLNYLKLAHAITSRQLALAIDTDIYKSIEDSLQIGEGTCSEFSAATYGIFRQLVLRAGREDILRKVRMVQGTASEQDVGGGHDWLEVYHNGKWRPYDASSDPLEQDSEITPTDIGELIKDAVVFRSSIKYNPTHRLWIDADGQRRTDIDVAGTVDNMGGVFYILLTSINR